MDTRLLPIITPILAILFIVTLFWGIDCVNKQKKQKYIAIALCAILYAITSLFFAVIASM